MKPEPLTEASRAPSPKLWGILGPAAILLFSWSSELGAQDRTLDWTFTEELRIGSVLGSEAESFYKLTPNSVTADESGRLYIADRGNMRVQVFERSGKFVRSISHEGQGPGELQNPVSVWRADAETISVFDWAPHRITTFTTEGEFVDDYSVPYFRGQFMHAGPGYEVYDVTIGNRSVDGEAPDSTVQLVRWVRSGDTTEIARLALTPPRRLFFLKPCKFFIDITPLFEPSLIWDFAAERLAVNIPYDYRIDVHQLDGARVTITRQIEPHRFTRDDAMEEIGDPPRMPNPRGRACGRFDADDILEKRGFYSFEQIIDRIQIAPDGTLWVKRKSPATEDGLVDVFDPSGAYLGTLAPDAPYPDAFTADGAIVVIELAEFDVEQVVVYSVTR